MEAPRESVWWYEDFGTRDSKPGNLPDLSIYLKMSLMSINPVENVGSKYYFLESNTQYHLQSSKSIDFPICRNRSWIDLLLYISIHIKIKIRGRYKWNKSVNYLIWKQHSTNPCVMHHTFSASRWSTHHLTCMRQMSLTLSAVMNASIISILISHGPFVISAQTRETTKSFDADSGFH